MDANTFFNNWGDNMMTFYGVIGLWRDDADWVIEVDADTHVRFTPTMENEHPAVTMSGDGTAIVVFSDADPE